MAFAAGSLSVLFTVSNATLFVTLVPEDQYVEGNSLIYSSRALSFVGGPSLGGLLMQLLSAPLAIGADALSFLGSAFFLRRIQPVEPPPAQRRGLADRGRPVHPPVGHRPGVAAVGGDDQLLQLRVLRAVRALRHPGPARPGRPARAGPRRGAIGGLVGSAVTKPRPRAIGVGWAYSSGCVLFTAPLLLVPLAGGPQAAGAGDAVPGRVRVGLRRHAAGHQHRVDLRRGHPRRAAVEGHRRVPGRQLRHPAARRRCPAASLGTLLGLRPTLWIATVGRLAGVLWLLPSPLPRFRMPVAPARPRATSGPARTRPDRRAGTGRRAAGQIRKNRFRNRSASAASPLAVPPLTRPNVVSTMLPGSNSSTAGRSSMLPGS